MKPVAQAFRSSTRLLLPVNQIRESTLAPPALVNGRWYIRTDRSLFAIGR